MVFPDLSASVLVPIALVIDNEIIVLSRFLKLVVLILIQILKHFLMLSYTILIEWIKRVGLDVSQFGESILFLLVKTGLFNDTASSCSLFVVHHS